jgi:hypothetical protein
MDTYQTYWVGEQGPEQLAQRLHFTPRGAAKLSNVAGMIAGIEMAGNRELAEHLAADLDGQLNRLAQWGGPMEVTVNAQGQELERPQSFPGTKVVLGDDGTLGGFTVGWYRAVTRARMEEHRGDSEFLDEAKKHFRISDDLTETRHRYPKWDTERQFGPDAIDMYYGYAFNGGLLLHGMGQPVFAVELNPKAGPHWSVHT